MKKLSFFLLLLALLPAFADAQKLDGAFRITAGQYGDKPIAQSDLQRQHVIKIFKDGYWIAAHFGDPQKPFSGTGGGTYKAANGKYTETLDYYSWDSTAVGDTYAFDYKLTRDSYFQNGKMDSEKYPNYIIREEFSKIKSPTPLKNSSLEGAWLLQNVTWRQEGKEENVKSFDQIKFYAYPRFAWAQFDAANKKFIAAGGGTYQYDGKRLTEHIEYITYPLALGTDYEINVVKEGPETIRQESQKGLIKEWWKKVKISSHQ
jgi:hypothetical protein